jgi:hypothetical protein
MIGPSANILVIVFLSLAQKPAAECQVNYGFSLNPYVGILLGISLLLRDPSNSHPPLLKRFFAFE